MEFMQYVSRQKQLIRDSRIGEEYLIINGEVLPLRPAEEILNELNTMDGLFKEGERFSGFTRDNGERQFAL